MIANIPEDVFGYPKSSMKNAWASCIRIVNPISGLTLSAIELDHNEAAFSLDLCTFSSDSEGVYLVLGTAQDVVLTPRSCTSGFLRLYKFNHEGTDMHLIHTVKIKRCIFMYRLLSNRFLMLFVHSRTKCWLDSEKCYEFTIWV